MGVGVPGPGVERLPVGDLDDLAEVHHGDPFGEVPYDGEVVRDEDEGDAELPLEVLQQVDDLRLDGDVQGGDGLVGDDQLRPQGEGAGDADALTLASGELVRVAVVVLGVEAHGLQELLGAPFVALGRVDAVEPHRRLDDGADGVPGVQRRVRVLEDHLEVAAGFPHPSGGPVGDVLAVEQDGAAGGFEQPGDQAARGRLAAAGLADQPQRLAGSDREVDAVDGSYGPDLPLEDDALPEGEVLLQTAHFEEVLAGGAVGGLPGEGLGGAHGMLPFVRRRHCAARAAAAPRSSGPAPPRISCLASSVRWHAARCPALPGTRRSSGRSTVHRPSGTQPL